MSDTAQTPEQLLAQLKPNILPEPVSWWPLAPFWWGVLTAVLVLLCGLAFWLWRRHQRNRYRRVALAELQALLEAPRDEGFAHRFSNECNALLKRVARIAYPEQHPESLTGEAWSAFLAQHAKLPQIEAAEAFSDARYRADVSIDIEQAHRLTQQWIRKHHV